MKCPVVNLENKSAGDIELDDSVLVCLPALIFCIVPSIGSWLNGDPAITRLKSVLKLKGARQNRLTRRERVALARAIKRRRICGVAVLPSVPRFGATLMA